MSGFASTDALLAAFYETLSGPAGPRDWKKLRSYFAPGAQLTRASGEPAKLETFALDAWISLSSLNLLAAPFYEREVSRREERHGPLCIATSDYELRRDPAGEPFATGTNVFTLFFDGKSWSIASASWTNRPSNAGAAMSRTTLIERTFRAPPESLWRACTDAAELTKWLCEKANVKPEEGGAFELFWEPEHPERNSTLGCRFTAFEPMKRLAFTWRGPVPFADLMNGEPPATSCEVRLEERDGATHMHFEHRGWGEGPRWDEAKAWQERAWSGAFEALKKLVEG